MSFKSAEIRKKANVYDGGKVTSRTIITADGENKTLGIMLPGSYNFNTGAAEIMELLGGTCRVRLTGNDDWNGYAESESFNVPANSSFNIEVVELLDYICHFE